MINWIDSEISHSRIEMGVNYHGFFSSLPHTSCGSDGIWVIMNQLTKSAYFLPIYISLYSERLAYIDICEIVRLHGLPISIILDRDFMFTTSFM